MVAVAVRLVCAWAIAVMVTMSFVGWVAGGVYSPFVSMVPYCALPLVTLLTCQVTKVLLRFCTDAVNCTVGPPAFAELSAPYTLMVGAAAVEPEPQEFKIVNPGNSARNKTKCCQRVFWTRRKILE
jgi:hypothetical protein